MQLATLTIAQNAKKAEEVLDLLLAKNSKASQVLLKDPDSATHASWHLWLPPHFNASLDLRYIWKQQVKNKEVVRKWKEWTQGANFSFNEGAVIYDRDVSHLETWGDKLDAIDFYVVVGQTRPVSSRPSSSLESYTEDGLNRDPGSVSFRIYLPTSTHGSAVAHEHIVTQDQFVRYAICGSL